MQILNVGVDNPYGVASTNPSSFGFPELSSNAIGDSSRFEVLEQSSRADARLSNPDSVYLFRSMPTGLPSSASSHQCAIEWPIEPPVSDQSTMQQSLTDSQLRPGLDSIQPVSTLSSSQYDQPVHDSDMTIIRKRPRLPQPTDGQRLNAVQRQLAKRTGVPEVSLGVMCFNTEPRPKRSRTSSQKQNKKDVENVGGSCFLCLIDKKKVFLKDVRPS